MAPLPAGCWLDLANGRHWQVIQSGRGGRERSGYLFLQLSGLLLGRSHIPLPTTQLLSGQRPLSHGYSSSGVRSCDSFHIEGITEQLLHSIHVRMNWLHPSQEEDGQFIGPSFDD